MATDAEIAWAAGLFEGEGSFNRLRGRLHPVMELSMTDEDMVRRFHQIVGCGQVTKRKYSQRKPHYKDQWRWYAGQWSDVYQLAGQFWPWFGARRQERLLELIVQGWDDRSPELPRRFGQTKHPGDVRWSDVSQRFIYARG